MTKAKYEVTRSGPVIENLAPIEESLSGQIEQWENALNHNVAALDWYEGEPEDFSLLDLFDGTLDLQVSKHGFYELCGFGGPHIETQVVVVNERVTEIIERRAWWSATERAVCTDADALDIAERLYAELVEYGFLDR